MAAQVLETLQEDERFWAALNLNGGLKTMTAKQYIQMVNHLAEKISGKPFADVAKGDPTNDIVTALKDLQYPFPLSKSLFKAPTTPHDFKSGVRLLHWMCDFAPKPDLEMFVGVDPRHPNIEYTNMFTQSMQEGYSLWNNRQDDEHEQLKQRLVDQLISARKGGVFDSEISLRAKTAQLNVESAALAKVSKALPREKRYQAAQSRFVQLDEEAMKLEIEVAAATDKFEACELNWKAKKEKCDTERRTVEEIQRIVATQHYSRSDFNLVKASVEEQNVQIDAEEDTMATIHDRSCQAKIRLAKLMRDRAEAESKLKMNLNDLVVLLNKPPYIEHHFAKGIVQLVDADQKLDLKQINHNMQKFLPVCIEMTAEMECSWLKKKLELKEMDSKLAVIRKERVVAKQQCDAAVQKLMQMKEQYATEQAEFEADMKARELNYDQLCKFCYFLDEDIDYKKAYHMKIREFVKDMNDRFEALFTKILGAGHTITEGVRKIADTLRVLENADHIDPDNRLELGLFICEDFMRLRNEQKIQLDREVYQLMESIETELYELNNKPWPLLSDTLNNPEFGDHPKRYETKFRKYDALILKDKADVNQKLQEMKNMRISLRPTNSVQ